ncbi:MAG TPA: methyltransferase domain-containing protein [Actinopolymorphaceae bacterium]
MIYQQPLAYLLGIEGLALLRAWAGDYDEDFVQARLAEVRQLLDEPLLAGHPGVSVARGSLEAGYQQWSESYDEPRNGLFDLDEPFMYEILDGLPTGVALDAACGTGRFASYLVQHAHHVIGVDSSPDMLTVARRRVPSAEFLLGELDELPVADDSADIVTCALALSHLSSLGPAMAEFARVLRPGGHLVISDVHAELILRGSVVQALGPADEPGLVPTFRHSTGDYLRAALSAGLVVRRCEEPWLHDGESEEYPAPEPGHMEPGPWGDWPWTLMWLIPDVIRALGDPILILWHFQMPE